MKSPLLPWVQSFNSTLVQLKENIAKDTIELDVSFNSTLVQLKV